MNRDLRYYVLRVAIGLTIGVCMFYFRSAHAQGTADGLAYYQRIFSDPAEAQAVWRQAAAPYVSPSTTTGSMAQAGLRGGQILASPGGPVVDFTRAVYLPTKKPMSLAVRETVKLTPQLLAGSVRLLAKSSPYLLLASAAYDLYKDDNLTYDTAEQRWEKDVTSYVSPLNAVGDTATSGASIYSGDRPITGAITSSTARSLVNSWASPGTNCTSSGHKWYVESDSPNNARNGCAANSSWGDYRGFAAVQVVPSSSCPTGYTYASGTCLKTDQLPATDDDLDQAWRNGNAGQDDIQKAAAVVPLLDQQNTPIDFSQAPSNATPNTTPIVEPLTTTTTTTRNPDGSTSTSTTTKTRETTVTNPTPSSDRTFTKETIQITVIERTVIRDTTTNTVTSDTTTEPSPPQPLANPDVSDGPTPPAPDPEPQPQDEIQFNDSAMPAVPALYERKYPNGLTGVWQSKQAQLRDSQFITGISSMFPAIGSGGTCPVWQLGLNFGPHANFGVQELKAPCWLWDVVGLIFLITATFTARRILFGG